METCQKMLSGGYQVHYFVAYRLEEADYLALLEGFRHGESGLL